MLSKKCLQAVINKQEAGLLPETGCTLSFFESCESLQQGRHHKREICGAKGKKGIQLCLFFTCKKTVS